MGATVAKDRAGYREASHDFEKAIEAWPDRIKRGLPIPPVSSGLRVLADAAHLLADGNSDPRVSHDLEEAADRPECSATDMPASKCQAVVAVGKLWLGWIAGREGRLADAARWFEPFADQGWPALVGGQAGDDRAPVPAGGSVVPAGSRPIRAGVGSGWLRRSDHVRTAPMCMFRLGSARFETHEYPRSIANLDEAVKLRPENARAVFVRARAQEKLGQSGIADLELASRTAFANDSAPGHGGQAHHVSRGGAVPEEGFRPRGTGVLECAQFRLRTR